MLSKHRDVLTDQDWADLDDNTSSVGPYYAQRRPMRNAGILAVHGGGRITSGILNYLVSKGIIDNPIGILGRVEHPLEL